MIPGEKSFNHLLTIDNRIPGDWGSLVQAVVNDG